MELSTRDSDFLFKASSTTIPPMGQRVLQAVIGLAGDKDSEKTAKQMLDVLKGILDPGFMLDFQIDYQSLKGQYASLKPFARMQGEKEIVINRFHLVASGKKLERILDKAIQVADSNIDHYYAAESGGPKVGRSGKI